MNSRTRAAVQRRLIAPRWLELGGRIDGGTLLEIGCGRGIGLRIAREQFGAGYTIGLDLDPKMIAAATREGASPLILGDVCEIPAHDASVDAVFDFGAIHIVPEWEKALREVHRVLRPGGGYCFEWVSFLPYRTFYRLGSARFAGMRTPRAREVIESLDRIGFAKTRFVRRRALAATQLTGDLVGVATR